MQQIGQSRGFYSGFEITMKQLIKRATSCSDMKTLEKFTS